MNQVPSRPETDDPVGATDGSTTSSAVDAPTDTEAGEDRRVPVGPLVATVGTVAMTVALAQVAGGLTDIVGLVALAALLAWMTGPVQQRMARRIGSGLSVTVLAIVALVMGIGIGGLLARDLSTGATALSERITDALAQDSGGTLADRLGRSLRLSDGIAEWLSSLPNTAVFGGEGTPAVGARLVDIVVVVVLMAFLRSSSASIMAGIVKLWPRPQRERLWALLGDVDNRAGSYLRHVATVGFVCGAALSALAIVIGMPMPVAIGLWAGFWMVVPAVGWVIGLAPFVLLAVSLQPVPAAVAVTAAVALTIGAIRYRRSQSKHVHLRPGIGIAVPSLAIGVAISGSASAILCFMLSVVGLAVVTSEHRSVQLPMPVLDEARAYRFGPVIVPHGLRGIILCAVTVMAAVISWSVIGRSASAIVWITIATLLAITIDRPVAFFARRLRLGRPIALGITLTLISAAIVAIVVTVVNEGPRSVTRAVDRLPRVVEDLEGSPLVGNWLKDHDAANVVARNLQALPGRVASSRGALGWFPSIGSQLVDVVWVMLLTVAFVLDGARMVAAIGRLVPVRNRRQFNRLVAVSHRGLAGYAAGAVLVSTICGSVVLVLALVLGVALAPAIALWAFMWDFVPQVGGFIGGLPLLLFSLIEGPVVFVIATVVYLLYQLIENNAIYPAIIGVSVDIPAWATMVAALVGAAAGGLLGAVVLTPLVGVLRLAMIEMRSDDFPGRTVPAVDAGR